MDSFSGTKVLHTFSPRWVDPQILEQTLVGRRELVDRLEELALDGAGGPNKHQRLIVGVRGSGKTHVLRVLHNRLWRNEELKKRLLIVYLLEDELGVASFLDFVVRLMRAIVHSYPEKRDLAVALESLYDLPAAMQRQRAVQLLLEAAGEKDILIIMENLGVTFDKARGFGHKGQQALRDLVQGHPRFMVFSSAQALVEGIREPNAPFFGFFKVIHLRRLSLDEAIAFLLAIAAAYGRQDIVDYLNTPRGRGRMRTIYQFTGGNHRLLVTFYDFLCAHSVARLSDLFIEALNPLKPFYQEQMRSLSAQQQKIVQYLSLQREPRTVKDIARGCLAAANTISSQLRDLLHRSFVTRIEQGRESYYEMTEALFRICYEADLERKGAPVRLFVDFLANLYTAQELQLRCRGFQLLAESKGCATTIPFADEARLYEEALSRYHPGMATTFRVSAEPMPQMEDKIRSFFRDLEKEGAYREVIEFAGHLGEIRDAFILRFEASAYARLGKREQAIASAKKALEQNADDIEAHLLLASIYSEEPGDKESALQHARRARDIKPDNPNTIARIGTIFRKSGGVADALQQFETLTREHPEYSSGWLLRAQTVEALGRIQEAEALYRQALDVDPANAYAKLLLGALLGNSGRYDEALEQCRAFNEARPGDSNGSLLTALTLRHLNRAKEAETQCRRALEVDPGKANAMLLLGALLGDTGRHAEALEQFDAINKLLPRDSQPLRLKGVALEKLGRIPEAEACYRKAVQLNPTDGEAMRPLGMLLARTGRHNEAVEQFRAFNEAYPGNSEGWRLTARSLRNLGRRKEAMAMCRRSVEVDPNNAEAVRLLGALLGDLGRYEEALKQFEAFNRAQPEDAEGWKLTARALDALGEKDRAEAAYRKALALDPGNMDAVRRLGMLLGSAGRDDEALEHFKVLNKVLPDDSHGWLMSAVALERLGRDHDAAALYRKAIQVDPANAVAMSRLGILLAKDERYAEALELFEAVNRAQPNDSDGWRMKAGVLQELGRMQEAELACRKALELDPANADAVALMGSLLGNLGRYDQALSQFEALQRLRPEDSDTWRLTAQALENLHRTDEAEAGYRKSLELDPGNADARQLLGALLGNARRYAEALRQFEALNSLQPEDSGGWLLTARTLDKMGRTEEAEGLYRKAIELDPANIEARRLLGMVLHDLGRSVEALEHLEAVSEARPQHSDGWLMTAELLYGLGRKEEAESRCRKALELDPTNAAASWLLGGLLYDAGNCAEAIQQFQAVNKANPEDAPGWQATAQTLQRLGRNQEAEAAYRKTLQLNPENAIARELLGALLYTPGRYSEALEQFEDLNRIQPDSVRGWQLTAQTLHRLGRMEDAESRYRKAIELDRADAVAWAGLSSVLEHLGRERESGDAFEEAIRLGADRSSLLNSRGEGKRACGKFELAIGDYQEALRADPTLAWAHFNMVSALLGLGKTDEALSVIPRAIEAVKEGTPSAHELLVQSLHENCVALFEHASPFSFVAFLSTALDTISNAGRLKAFEESLPLTVFALLNGSSRSSEGRLQAILSAFESVLGGRMDVSVAIRFLRVGIAYFRHGDRKALLNLAREERLTFCKELGIDDPSE